MDNQTKFIKTETTATATATATASTSSTTAGHHRNQKYKNVCMYSIFLDRCYYVTAKQPEIIDNIDLTQTLQHLPAARALLELSMSSHVANQAQGDGPETTIQDQELDRRFYQCMYEIRRDVDCPAISKFMKMVESVVPKENQDRHFAGLLITFSQTLGYYSCLNPALRGLNAMLDSVLYSAKVKGEKLAMFKRITRIFRSVFDSVSGVYFDGVSDISQLMRFILEQQGAKSSDCQTIIGLLAQFVPLKVGSMLVLPIVIACEQGRSTITDPALAIVSTRDQQVRSVVMNAMEDVTLFAFLGLGIKSRLKKYFDERFIDTMLHVTTQRNADNNSDAEMSNATAQEPIQKSTITTTTTATNNET